MTEADFLRQVLQLARLLHWRTAHFRTALTQRGHWATAVQGDGKGFPDLILVKGERLIAAELKSGSGRVTAEQEAWLDAFRSCGAEVHVWRPGDWAEIETTLGLEKEP